MRNLLLSAAVALLACALPGVASAQTGYAGVSWSTVDVDNADNADAWGVDGAVAFEGSSSISFEVDAAYADSDDADGAVGLTGHVFTRNEDFLFGGFVGVSDSDDSTTWTGGLEANKYLTDWTFAGAVAYAKDDDNDVEGWGVNAEARYFVTDNFRAQGNIGWANVDFGGGADDDAITAGIGAEYQLDAAPVSFLANYSHTTFDEADFDADAFTLGVRYNWGGTLRDRDRHGASQAGIAGVGGIL
jgi:hypothetical protein